VSDREESRERLRRGADESAARQAELRARSERVDHRGDFIEQVRRGADKTGVRSAELRARLERLRAGEPVTVEDLAAAAAASAAARDDAADAHERGADFHELAGYVHEAAAQEHEQAVREGVGDPIRHLRRAKELRAAAAAERALSQRDREGAEADRKRP
jgi:siroheme synthase